MPGLPSKPKLLWFRRRIEQGTAETYRDHCVALAMQNQNRGLYSANPRKRVETVAYQQRDRQKGVMVLGDLGHAGEGRFKDQGSDLALRRQMCSYARPQRLAVNHDPVRCDAFMREKIE